METSFFGHNQTQGPDGSFNFMNIQKAEDFLPYLPSEYETRFQTFESLEHERAAFEDSDSLDSTWFRTDIRLKIYTPAELFQWIEKFERITKTHWNKTKSATRREPKAKTKITYKQALCCQHSKHNKVKEYRKHEKKQKNQFCGATMYVRIRRDSESAKVRDPHYGYFGHIFIKWAHSHALTDIQSLSFLRNPQLKKLFEQEYFEKGLLPTAACRARSEHLQSLPGFELSWLDNTSICPSDKQAWQWFKQWRTTYPHPLPAAVPASKPQKASRTKRDDLVSEIADLLTEKFTLLTGNPSNFEVETLEGMRDSLASIHTKNELLVTFKKAQLETAEGWGRAPIRTVVKIEKGEQSGSPSHVGLGLRSAKRKRRAPGGNTTIEHRRESGDFEEEFVGIDIDDV